MERASSPPQFFDKVQVKKFYISDNQKKYLGNKIKIIKIFNTIRIDPSMVFLVQSCSKGVTLSTSEDVPWRVNPMTLAWASYAK